VDTFLPVPCYLCLAASLSLKHRTCSAVTSLPLASTYASARIGTNVRQDPRRGHSDAQMTAAITSPAIPIAVASHGPAASNRPGMS